MVIGGWAGNGDPGEAVWWCIHPAVCGTRAGGDLSLHGRAWCPSYRNWSPMWVTHLSLSCLCGALHRELVTDMSQSLSLSCLHGALHTQTEHWHVSVIVFVMPAWCPFIQKLVSDLSHSSFFVMSAYRNWSPTWITHLPFSHLRLWDCGIHPLTSPTHPQFCLSVSRSVCLNFSLLISLSVSPSLSVSLSVSIHLPVFLSPISQIVLQCVLIVFSPVGMDSLAKTGVTDFLCFCNGSLDMGLNGLICMWLPVSVLSLFTVLLCLLQLK